MREAVATGASGEQRRGSAPDPTRRHGRALALCMALSCAAAPPLWAQQADTPPARFRLAAIDLKGATLLPATEWQDLLDAAQGREIGFADLEALRASIETRFHAAGWRLVQVRIPAQDVDGGRIRMDVVEPRIGRVTIAGNNNFDTANWRATFPMLREGAAPNLAALDKALTLAAENSAKRPQVAFAAGATADEVNTTIRAEDAPPAGWIGFLDNTGNSQTGRLRYGLAWRHGNLFDADHQINAQFISAPHDADRPQRLSLLPSSKVRIFGLGYRVPFYALGASANLTLGYSDVNSGQVDQLFTIRGKGSSAAFNWTQLLDRPQGEQLRGWELRWFVGADWRDFKSQLLFGNVDLGVPISLHPLSLGISGSRPATPQQALALRFHGGVWANVPGGAHGRDAAFTASRAGAKPAYSLLRYGGGINLPLGDWRLDGSLEGQWSGDLLVPAEQFSAGGIGTVRGFSARGISGDSGLRLQLEALGPPLLQESAGAQVHGLVFLDAAHARRNSPTVLEAATGAIASVGIGLRANWGPVVLRMDLGKPVHQRTGAAPETGTVHFSLASSF